MEFSATQIAMLLGGKVVGDGNRKVSDVAPIETAQGHQLAFLTDAKYLPCLETTQAGVVLVSAGLVDRCAEGIRSIDRCAEGIRSIDRCAEGIRSIDRCAEGIRSIDRCAEGIKTASLSEVRSQTLILVENARGAMGQLLQLVAKAMNPKRSGMEQPSFVSEGVQIPEDAYIGAFAYIGKNVRLGKGVQIYPHCFIGDNVVIGDNTVLYDGVKVYYNCEVGKDCILHAGVVIGGDGFGFEPDAQGVNRKIEQIGNVVIEDDVEIGANSTVDRAMMGTTRVGRNTKIDNLVQVGHNVQIGESCFLCAQVGIAGSTKIGNRCILAGQVGVAGHIEIADNTILGAQSGVAGSIRQSGTYQGSPAFDAMQWRKASVVFKQLPEMWKTINQLSKNN